MHLRMQHWRFIDENTWLFSNLTIYTTIHTLPTSLPLNNWILTLLMKDSFSLIYILTVMRKTATATTAVTIAYNHLMQEWARRSTYFCEKACAGGLVIPLLIRVQNLTSFLETEVSCIGLQIYCANFTCLLPCCFLVTTVPSKRSAWYEIDCDKWWRNKYLLLSYLTFLKTATLSYLELVNLHLVY